MNNSKYHHGNLKTALIRAGVEILSSEGIEGLSLRKVAKSAGVSHNAPYSHFSDKQALIAAISTEGHSILHDKLSSILEDHHQEPLKVVMLTAHEYLRFSLDDQDLFRITFSGAVEQEKDYPELVEITQKNIGIIEEIVGLCQADGIFGEGDIAMIALNLWSSVHGLIALLQQGQVSSKVLDQKSPEELLAFTLDQLTVVKITKESFESVLT